MLLQCPKESYENKLVAEKWENQESLQGCAEFLFLQLILPLGIFQKIQHRQLLLMLYLKIFEMKQSFYKLKITNLAELVKADYNFHL